VKQRARGGKRGARGEKERGERERRGRGREKRRREVGRRGGEGTRERG